MTFTQDEGSEAEARTAAIHCAARVETSSPRRTITLPRGMRVKTLSTERAAASRRAAVRLPS